MKAEDKLARIGECLQKTAPPVLIFAERTRDVDMVHEYLLMKGVNAVAIHGAAPRQCVRCVRNLQIASLACFCHALGGLPDTHHSLGMVASGCMQHADVAQFSHRS